MKPLDHKTLYIGLAALVAVQEGEDLSHPATVARARQMAEDIEAFCTANVLSVSLPRDADIGALDDNIKRHVQELRQKEETHLPEDKESLIRLCDRLCQRQAWRKQRSFYARASEAALAKVALAYLDEEIEDARALT